jgi:hypothetical protein
MLQAGTINSPIAMNSTVNHTIDWFLKFENENALKAWSAALEFAAQSFANRGQKSTRGEKKKKNFFYCKKIFLRNFFSLFFSFFFKKILHKIFFFFFPSSIWS